MVAAFSVYVCVCGGGGVGEAAAVVANPQHPADGALAFFIPTNALTALVVSRSNPRESY